MSARAKPLSRRTVVALAPLSLAAGFLQGCAPEAVKFQSIDLTGADYARGFSLTDHNGQVRTLQDFRGKITLVFFGFTQCPDVCPTTMAELAEIKTMLGANGNKLQAIFITVDPARDSLDILKAYMGNFDPTFLALRPDRNQLAAVAKEFKVYYKKVEGRRENAYSMDHTAGNYVFDLQGRIRLYARYGQDPKALASDIGLLLKNA